MTPSIIWKPPRVSSHHGFGPVATHVDSPFRSVIKSSVIWPHRQTMLLPSIYSSTWLWYLRPGYRETQVLGFTWSRMHKSTQSFVIKSPLKLEDALTCYPWELSLSVCYGCQLRRVCGTSTIITSELWMTSKESISNLCSIFCSGSPLISSPCLPSLGLWQYFQLAAQICLLSFAGFLL